MSDKGKIIKGFEVMLKNYFFNLPEVQSKYIVPRPEQLLNSELSDFEKKSLSVNKAAREFAFNRYMARIKASASVFNAETGEPYPADNTDDKLYKIAYDFYLGKKIALPGAGSNDDMISIKSENNGKYRHFITLDCNNEDNIPNFIDLASENRKSFEYGVEINPDFKISEEGKFKTIPAQVDKPKGGGWWNSICKAILGRPSARWQQYEDYQKVQRFNTAAEDQRSMKTMRTELDDNLVEKDKENVKRDPDRFGKKYDIPELQNKKASEYSSKSIADNTLKEKFGYDENSKQWVKADTLKRQKAREEASKKKVINEEPVKDESVKEENENVIENNEKTIKQSVKSEPEKVKPEPVKEVKPDPGKKQREEGYKKFKDYVIGEKYSPKKGTLSEDKRLQGFGRNKNVIKDIYASLDRITAFADPNKGVEDMTRETLAEDIATLYMAQKMSGDLRYRRLNENERDSEIGNDYRTVLDDMVGDRRLHKQIKENLLANDELMNTFMEKPSTLIDSLYAKKENSLLAFVDKSTDNLIERESEKLLNAQIEKEKAANQKNMSLHNF